MKRRVVSAVILSAMAMLLSGCIFHHWHDDRGNHYGHAKSKRGGGDGGKRR